MVGEWSGDQIVGPGRSWGSFQSQIQHVSCHAIKFDQGKGKRKGIKKFRIATPSREKKNRLFSFLPRWISTSPVQRTFLSLTTGQKGSSLMNCYDNRNSNHNVPWSLKEQVGQRAFYPWTRP